MNPTLSDFVLNPFPTEQPNVIKMDTTVGLENCEDPIQRKPWKRPGAPVEKVAPDVKRRRRNYQAKKLLLPKNPLMILNELKPGLPFTFSEKLNESNQSIFVASVEIDEGTFRGEASSKKQAQQEAAEAALRGLFFDKLMEQLVKKEVDNDVVMKDTDGQVDGVVKSQVPEDDTPWSGLASLAMFKLANMWQCPDAQSAPVTIQAPPASPCLKGKLPPNANEVDPVMLLNQISPQSKFTEQARDVRNGATVFTLTVEFNGQTFIGSATKKKTAKKNCAKSALKTLGVEYND